VIVTRQMSRKKTSGQSSGWRTRSTVAQDHLCYGDFVPTISASRDTKVAALHTVGEPLQCDPSTNKFSVQRRAHQDAYETTWRRARETA
jgi:hypothetical protein